MLDPLSWGAGLVVLLVVAVMAKRVLSALITVALLCWLAGHNGLLDAVPSLREGVLPWLPWT